MFLDSSFYAELVKYNYPVPIHFDAFIFSRFHIGPISEEADPPFVGCRLLVGSRSAPISVVTIVPVTCSSTVTDRNASKQ